MSYYSPAVDALSKDLAEIFEEKRAERTEPAGHHEEGPSGLELIALGQTCCKGVDDIVKAAGHCAEQAIKVAQLGQLLSELQAKKIATIASFVKEAKSRLDKEVELGNIAYSDVDASLPKALGTSSIGKKLTRESAHQPAPRSIEEVARKRDLSAAIFKNRHLSEAAREVPVSLGASHPSVAMIGANPQLGTMNVPHESGRFLRTMVSPGGLGRIGGAAIAGGLAERKDIADKMYVPARGVDQTLNNAALEHEFGEIRSHKPSGIYPHASHLGVEPIIRENIATVGDPEASGVFRKVRGLHPDDRRVQGLVRQVGGHPDAPLPIGGRHQRALERTLERSGRSLDRSTRKQNVASQFISDIPVRTLPGDVRESIGKLKGALPELQNEVSALRAQGMSTKGLRSLFSSARGILPHFSTLNRYMK